MTMYDAKGKATEDESKGISEYDLVLTMLDNIGDLRDYHGYVPKDRLDDFIKRANFETYFKTQAFDKEVSKNWDDIAGKEENWNEIVDKKTQKSLGSQMTFVGGKDLDVEVSEKSEKKKAPAPKRPKKSSNAAVPEGQTNIFDLLMDMEK